MHEFICMAYEKWTIDRYKFTNNEMLKKYIELVQIYPVSNLNEMKKYWIDLTKTPLEEWKTISLNHFINIYLEEKINEIYSNNERPDIKFWFSDDDKKNIEAMEIFIKKWWIGDSMLPYLFSTSSWKIEKIIL